MPRIPFIGRAHFVAHIRQEFALGAIGGLGRIFGQAQLAFHALALRGGRQHIRHGLQKIHVLIGEFALDDGTRAHHSPRLDGRRRL